MAGGSWRKWNLSQNQLQLLLGRLEFRVRRSKQQWHMSFKRHKRRTPARPPPRPPAPPAIKSKSPNSLTLTNPEHNESEVQNPFVSQC